MSWNGHQRRHDWRPSVRLIVAVPVTAESISNIVLVLFNTWISILGPLWRQVSDQGLPFAFEMVKNL
jgi:hypothetical protein